MLADRGDGADDGADADGRPDGADAPGVSGPERTGLEQGDGPASDEGSPPKDGSAPERADTPAERVIAYRDQVETVRRTYAIDQGCAEVEKIETDTTTPAMLRIEAEDPGRRLMGFENRLKGKERLAEKVENWLTAQPDLQPEDAFRLAKDAIRYTFVYDDAKYSAGVYADCERLRSEGFEPGDRQNSWTSDQYKGINGRWREPGSGLLFEVQFHTQDSYNAKQVTHTAYEQIRDPSTSPGEISQLRAYQRQVCATIPIPPGATGIPDYNYL